MLFLGKARQRYFDNALSKLLPDLLSLVLLTLGISAAIRAFWLPGIANDADMLIGIYRAFELDQSWGAGIFFPRLALDINFGYGGPLFQYYPPLASYLTLPFHWAGLGWIESTKAVFTTGIFLAGYGAYAYGRWLFRDSRAALVTAGAYALAPYLLLDVYERGALAEVLALALLPWLLWATHHLLETGERKWFAATAGCTALMVLAHNITTLFVLPFLAAYLGLLAWHTRAWKHLRAVGLSLALGLGMSAFYWLPAIAERSYAQIEISMLAGFLAADANLVPVKDLIQRQLTFEYWGPMEYRLALWQAVLGGLAVAAVLFTRGRLRPLLLLLTVALLVMLFLQLEASRLFWETVPLARFIQFPWRLLGLASLCVALLLGSILCLPRLAGMAGWLVSAALLAGIFYAGVQNLPVLLPGWLPTSNADINQADLFERGRHGFALFGDYLPVSVTEDYRNLGKRVPEGLDAPAGVQIRPEASSQLGMTVQTERPFDLRLHRIFFPGWQIYVDGRAVPTVASGPFGLVSASVPAGRHSVTAAFTETPLRRLADAISVLSLLAWLGVMIWGPLAYARNQSQIR